MTAWHKAFQTRPGQTNQPNEANSSHKGAAAESQNPKENKISHVIYFNFSTDIITISQLSDSLIQFHFADHLIQKLNQSYNCQLNSSADFVIKQNNAQKLLNRTWAN